MTTTTNSGRKEARGTDRSADATRSEDSGATSGEWARGRERCPISRSKDVGDVIHRVQPEARTIDEALVQSLEIGDGSPTDGLWHEK